MMKDYLETAIPAVITKELIKPSYRTANPIGGSCYIAAEAAFHLLGGKSSGFIPQVGKVEGLTHWWLKHSLTGEVIDPTKTQFDSDEERQEFYNVGRGCGFLTKTASKNAQKIITRVLARKLPK